MKKLIFGRPDQVSEIRHYGFLAVGEAVRAHICSADVFYDPYYLGKNLNQESGVSRKIWEIVPTLLQHGRMYLAWTFGYTVSTIFVTAIQFICLCLTILSCVVTGSLRTQPPDAHTY